GGEGEASFRILCFLSHAFGFSPSLLLATRRVGQLRVFEDPGFSLLSFVPGSFQGEGTAVLLSGRDLRTSKP
ncbi:hypothetical protein HPP92_027907, partial [Vanilla planifolia]